MITELDSYFLLLKTLLYSGLIYCILLESPLLLTLQQIVLSGRFH